MKSLKHGLAALLLTLVSATAGAASTPGLDVVLPIIARQVPGTMLDARPSRSPQGGMRYQIKWLTADGRVVWLSVDARTGRVAG